VFTFGLLGWKKIKTNPLKIKPVGSANNHPEENNEDDFGISCRERDRGKLLAGNFDSDSRNFGVRLSYNQTLETAATVGQNLDVTG